MPKGGCFEERHDYLLTNGIYSEWSGVFEQYVELALGGNTEALKRSLFFLWYQCSEPNQLSGLSDLNEQLIEKILRMVANQAKGSALDLEMQFMLPYYFQVCSWYFERFSKLDALTNQSLTNTELWQTEAAKQSWAHRGIMGDYWSSKGL